MEAMTKAQISKTAKALATKAGVKTTVRSNYGSVTVTFLSQPTDALVEAIEALKTTWARDIGAGEVYYEGTSVDLRFQFEVSAEDAATVQAIRAQYNYPQRSYDHATEYHFTNKLTETLGRARSRNALDKGL